LRRNHQAPVALGSGFVRRPGGRRQCVTRVLSTPQRNSSAVARCIYFECQLTYTEVLGPSHTDAVVATAVEGVATTEKVSLNRYVSQRDFRE